MALTTQLLVKIQGNADGLISALAKTGKGSRDAFKEVSTSAKTEFEKARREADRLYKDVARLQKESANAAKVGNSGLAGALSSEAARRAAMADQAAAAVISAEKRIAAESIKTGAITKTALAGGASGAGAAFAREGGAISRVFGNIRTEATKTGAAIKTGLSSGAFEGLGKTAAVAGAGMLAGFAVATKATLSFDKQLSSTRAVLDGTAQDMSRLRQAALDAGDATVFSATEAARAETELAKAGISVQDILGGGLSGVLNLAASDNLELAEAATIAARAMTTFGLSGDDVGHIADVLASAAGASTASVASLAEGLSESGGVAKQFGFSLEDTVATLALFDQNALRGAEGGNALKTMLLRLGAPTATAAKAMDDLGIAVYDSVGAVRPASQLFDQLREKLAPLSDEQRNLAMQTIFGTRAIRGAAIAAKEGGQDFGFFREEVSKQGSAAKMASTQMDNLAGDLERIKGSLEKGLIGAGSGATGVLRAVANSAEDAADAFGSLPSGVQGTVGVLTGLSGVALTVGGAIGIMAPKIAAARDGLIGLGAGGKAAATGLGVLGKVGGAAVGIFAIATALDALGDKIVELSTGKVNIGEIGKNLVDLGESGKVSGRLAAEFGGDLEKLADKIKTVTAFGKTGKLDILHPTAFKNAKGDIDALDKALTQLAASGPAGAEAAKRSFDTLATAAGKEGIGRKDLLKQLNDYAKASGNAELQAKLAGSSISKTGDAAKDAAGGTKTLAQNQEELAAAAEEASQALSKELEMLTGLTDLNLGVSNSNIAFIESLATLKKSLEENGKSFDLNTEAGRKNQSALNDAIGEAQAFAQAVGESTAATQGNEAGLAAANAALQQHRSSLVETAVATGLSREEATRLVDALLQIKSPPPVAVTADTKPARDQLEAFMRDQQRRELVIKTRFVPGSAVPTGGGAVFRALGGPVRKDREYQVGEKGAELFVPAQGKPLQKSAASHLATRAEKEAKDGLVRLGIPGGIEAKQSRSGTAALLLGKKGPQMFTPPTDGVVVKASDTKRLQRTDDADIISRILKRAGADRRTLDALTNAPARATGGRVKKGETYAVGERGAEVFAPKFAFNAPRQATPSVGGPGIKRASDGSYTITVGDTNLVVEAGSSGSAKGVNKADVDRIVERKQAELVAELAAAMRTA